MLQRPAALMPQEQVTWDALAAVLVQLPAALDHEVLEVAELSYFEFTVLAALADAPGQRLQMADLAERTHGSLSRMSHTVRRLERAGLVGREPSRDDRRVTLVVLCDSGRALRDELAGGVLGLVRAAVVDGLDEHEVAALGHAATTILSRLSALREGSEPPRRRYRRTRQGTALTPPARGLDALDPGR